MFFFQEDHHCKFQHRIFLKKSNLSCSYPSGHIKVDNMKNCGQKQGLKKKVKTQDSMGQKYFSFGAMPFSPWAFL
jgi:hypothetical protein